MMKKSLRAQSNDWIDCRGAAGRQIGCDHRSSNQNERHTGKRSGVGGRHAKKERLNEGFQPDRSNESNANAECGKKKSLAKNHPQDARRSSSQCEPDSNFANSLANSERHDSADTGSSDQQRKPSKNCKEGGSDSRRGNGFAARLFQSQNVSHGGLGIDIVYRASKCVSHRSGIRYGAHDQSGRVGAFRLRNIKLRRNRMFEAEFPDVSDDTNDGGPSFTVVP